MAGLCRRKSRVWLLAAMTILLAGVASCYPGEISSVGEADLVLTFFDSAADFTTKVTYTMPDSIVRIAEDGGSGSANPAVDAQILALIEAEFTAIDYQRVAVGGAAPDVVVLVTAASVAIDYWSTGGWWGYWGWWPGWGPGFGPGWTPAYPWGPAYPGTQAVGTLVITMLDPNMTSAVDQEIRAIWAGVINGLLQGSDQGILIRMPGLIHQVFVQSDYL